MIHVNVRAAIKPECLDAYVEVLRDIVPKVCAEEGCIQYEPCFDWSEDGTRAPFVTMVEIWISKAALDAHLAGPNIAELRKRIVGMREGASDMHTLTPVFPKA